MKKKLMMKASIHPELCGRPRSLIFPFFAVADEMGKGGHRPCLFLRPS